jgi:arsenate reductase-like glutaredoxin family protein
VHGRDPTLTQSKLRAFLRNTGDGFRNCFELSQHKSANTQTNRHTQTQTDTLMAYISLIAWFKRLQQQRVQYKHGVAGSSFTGMGL